MNDLLSDEMPEYITSYNYAHTTPKTGHGYKIDTPQFINKKWQIEL